MEKDFFSKYLLLGTLLIAGFFVIGKEFVPCFWVPPSHISGVYSVGFKGKIVSIDEGRGIYVRFCANSTWYNVGGFCNHRKKFFLNDKAGFEWGDSLMKKENTDILYLKKRSGEIDTFEYLP